jgi:ribosomal protein L10
MKREDIEKAAEDLLKSIRYISAVNDEIRGLQLHHIQQFKRQVAKGIIQQVNAALEEAAKEIPTSWLDPLLSGPNALISKPPHSIDVERLLITIKASIEDHKIKD